MKATGNALKLLKDAACGREGRKVELFHELVGIRKALSGDLIGGQGAEDLEGLGLRKGGAQ